MGFMKSSAYWNTEIGILASGKGGICTIPAFIIVEDELCVRSNSLLTITTDHASNAQLLPNENHWKVEDFWTPDKAEERLG